MGRLVSLLCLVAGLPVGASAALVSAEDSARIAQACPAAAPAPALQPRRLLVFTLARGFVHSAIPIGAEAVRIMGEKTGAYETVISDDIGMFEPAKLKEFSAVCFMNNSGELFLPPDLAELDEPARKAALARDAALKASLMDFVLRGGGLAGVHAATDCFYEWPEFGELLGGYFNGHPWNERVGVKIDDPGSPICRAFGGKGFEIEDEIYQFREPYSRDRVRVLLSMDRSITPEKGDRTDEDYALAWIRRHEAGRIFYSAFGHRHEIFFDPAQLEFLLAGLQYVLGDLQADATPLGAVGPADPWTGEYSGVDKSGRRPVTIEAKVLPEGRGQYRAALTAGDSHLALRGRAENGKLVLRRFSFDEYLTGWSAAGPYTAPDAELEGLLDSDFPPETQEVDWRPLTPADPAKPWLADLDASLGGENCVAYLLTDFESTTAQAADLVLGSDDGIKAWLNGELVHENNVFRGLEPESDMVRVQLKQGRNKLMLKVSQGTGGWAACAGVRPLGGGRIGGRPGKGAAGVWEGEIAGGVFVLERGGNKPVRVELARRDRKSSTLGAKPPAGALVLLPFGEGPPSLGAWTNENWHRLPDGSVRVNDGDNLTRREFGDCDLHVEFMIPYEPAGRGQGRGNSGVYLQNRYEVQVLDSFGLDTASNECGGIYKVAVPKVNASLPPLHWQTYDISFKAPRLDADGSVKKFARMTVRHNGILIHDDVEIPHPTGGGAEDVAALGPVKLQDHGNPVRYRNIWLVER